MSNPSQQQANTAAGRIKSASAALSRQVDAANQAKGADLRYGIIKELLDEIDGCSAIVREWLGPINQSS